MAKAKAAEEKKKTQSRQALNRNDFITEIAQASGNTKIAVTKMWAVTPQVILDAVAKNPPKPGEKVVLTLPDIGILAFRHVPERQITLNFNSLPRDKNGDKQTRIIKAHVNATFKLTKSFRTGLNPQLQKEAAKAAKKAAPAPAAKKKA